MRGLLLQAREIPSVQFKYKENLFEGYKLGYTSQVAARKKKAGSRAVLRTRIFGAIGSSPRLRPLEETSISTVFSVWRLRWGVRGPGKRIGGA